MNVRPSLSLMVDYHGQRRMTGLAMLAAAGSGLPIR